MKWLLIVLTEVNTIAPTLIVILIVSTCAQVGSAQNGMCASGTSAKKLCAKKLCASGFREDVQFSCSISTK